MLLVMLLAGFTKRAKNQKHRPATDTTASVDTRPLGAAPWRVLRMPKRSGDPHLATAARRGDNGGLELSA